MPVTFVGGEIVDRWSADVKGCYKGKAPREEEQITKKKISLYYNPVLSLTCYNVGSNKAVFLLCYT